MQKKRGDKDLADEEMLEKDTHTGFILHGAIVYSEDPQTVKSYDDAYVVCVDGICQGVFKSIPKLFSGLPVEDYWDKLIIPGLIDLHTHASQYQFRGLGMDLELMDWLNKNAFPEEAKYKNREYAERAYDQFIEDLYVGPTTRAVIFATKYLASTIALMDMLEETGLVTFVGKVNMDRLVPDYYVETTEKSLGTTKRWLSRIKDRYENTYPILTPRFVPACSRGLLEALGKLAEEKKLPVQSHLSESPGEIELVHQLEPDVKTYAEAYERCGLLGTAGPTIMAHCVWSDDEETALLKKRRVFIAHCPESNANLRSGAAPVSKYIDEGLKVGLGTDVAGGASALMFRAMREAVTASKLRWRLCDRNVRPLTFSDVFYLATKGGGEFFGKVGSFEKGFEFDAVIIDDESVYPISGLHARERAERIVYLGDDRHVCGKYVRGVKLY